MPALQTAPDRLDARDSYSPQMTDVGVRAQMAVDRMTQQGIPYSNAVGIVGNFLKEAPTLNPLQVQGVGVNTPAAWGTTVADMSVPKAGGYSLSQTTAKDRKDNLTNFLAMQPKDMSAFLAAVDFTVKEIKETPRYSALAKNPMSVDDAAEFAAVKYETPQKVLDGGFAKQQEIEDRQMKAEMLAGLLSGVKPGDVSQSFVDWSGARLDGMPIGDFGPPVWDGATDQTTLAAPTGAVFNGGDLPDITPSAGFSESVFGSGFSPSFASDQPDRGFQSAPADTGWAGDGGWHNTTPQDFGGFGQSGAVDQGAMTDGGFHSQQPQQSSFSPTISDYGFSSMNTTTPAMETLGNQLSREYASTPPSMGYETPASRPMDRPTVAASNPISSGDTYGFAPGFSTTPMGTMPSMSASFGLTPSTPTEETPAPVEGFPELPPEVPAPNFATVAAPKAPTFATAPKAPTIAAPPPVAKPPAPITPPKAPVSFSAPAAAPQAAAATPSAPPDFSTAFNGLWGPNAAANRGAFSGMTGLSDATVNALTSAYDAGGMLTGAAYSGLMDAFNSPKTASSPDFTTPNFAANAVSPVFSAPIADLTNLVSNPGGSQLDSRGGIVGSYTQGGGLYGGSINDLAEMAGYGWGGFGGSSSTDGTNPGLR